MVASWQISWLLLVLAAGNPTDVVSLFQTKVKAHGLKYVDPPSFLEAEQHLVAGTIQLKASNSCADEVAAPSADPLNLASKKATAKTEKTAQKESGWPGMGVNVKWLFDNGMGMDEQKEEENAFEGYRKAMEAAEADD